MAVESSIKPKNDSAPAEKDKKKGATLTESGDYKYILEVKDLYTYFFTEEGVVKAVDGVSFVIPKDKILGLVGETGCGKSVTALSIMRLIRYPGQIVKGHIYFKGDDLVKKTEKEMQEYRGNTITMIFQDPLNSLNPVFKVGDQIAEVFLLHQKEYLESELEKEIAENNRRKEKLTILKDMKKKIKEMGGRINADSLPDPVKETLKLKDEISADELAEKLESEIKKLRKKIKRKITVKDIAWRESAKILSLINIPDAENMLDRYPHELSGGMRQRVMIAMALACEPDLLICDEPTTALDVTVQAQILELIRQQKERLHNSILFITHDLGVIYELCDFVAVMYSGRIVEYGTVKQVMEDPKHPYTVGLIEAIPKINPEERKKRLETIPGMVPNLIFPPTGCRFHPRCKYAMKICKTINPPLVEVEGRKVACHLFDADKNNPEKKELYEPLPDKDKEYAV